MPGSGPLGQYSRRGDLSAVEPVALTLGIVRQGSRTDESQAAVDRLLCASPISHEGGSWLEGKGSLVPVATFSLGGYLK